MRRVATHIVIATLCWFTLFAGLDHFEWRAVSPPTQSVLVVPAEPDAEPIVPATASIEPSGLTSDQALAFHDGLRRYVEANRSQDWRTVSTQLSGTIGYVYPWQASRNVAKQLRAARALHVLDFAPDSIQISTANLGLHIEERCWDIHGCMTQRVQGIDDQVQGGLFAYYDGQDWRFSAFYVMRNGVTGRSYSCGERIGDWGQPN